MWRIAIVDDEQQVLQGLKRIIPWEELHAEPAGEAMDGEQGVRLILEKQPDIVITDIYMPVKNGLEMIEELRSLQFTGKFVVLSGYADFEYARKALRLGVGDYLSKPVTVKTIREVLGRVIEELDRNQAAARQAEEWKRKASLMEPLLEQERFKMIVTGVGRRHDERLELEAEEWTQRQFRVLALEFSREDESEGWQAGDWQLFRYAVGNMARELGAELQLELGVLELQGRHMALLLRMPCHTAEPHSKKLAIDLARRLVQAAQAYLQLRLQVGIGAAKAHWTQISDSTEEAFRALHAKRCVPDEIYPVFCHKRKKEEEERDSPVTLRLYQELAEAIRGFDKERAEAALGELETKLQGLPDVSAAELQRLAGEIWTAFGFALHESGIALEESYPREEINRELKDILLLPDFSRWGRERIADLCARFGRIEYGKHRHAIDFIIRYINEHYAEDVRLSDLAEKVALSRNYLSAVFRDATGETISDYLIRVRMERAKSLLLEGRLMVYEVAERVGYKNVPYFTTLFKRHTGQNPTAFVKK